MNQPLLLTRDDLREVVEEAVAPLREDIRGLDKRVGKLEDLYSTTLQEVREDTAVTRDLVEEIRRSPLLDGALPENRTDAPEGKREELLRPAGV